MEVINSNLKATEAKVVLASNSPRRRQLLQIIQPEFVVAQSKDIVEVYPKDMALQQVPVYLSQLKSQAYKDDINPGEILITADTVVINRGKILGKPADEAEAKEMLLELSGNTHHVVTGVTLLSYKQTLSFAETTEVTFAPLTEKEICTYVECYRPFDKAGAYGIQEWIGCVGISSIKGCFYNVMGLPTQALFKRLKSFPY